jgi:hypothetical protein
MAQLNNDHMRFALALSLMFAAAPACAEWVKVGTTNTAVHYVDPATVRSDGNLRQVWLLQDMVEADLDGVRSVRALQELNCQDGRYRFLSVTAYSGPMAGGHVVVEHGMRDGWSVIPPILNRSAVADIVCKR